MKKNNIGSPFDRLPVTRDLTLAYGLSLAVALIMTVAAVVGLLYPNIIYPSDKLLQSLVPTDLVILVIGLPILLVSMWLARRGKLIGLLCWPGALFYIVYIYVPYVLSVPFGVLFLPYLVLLTLSMCTMIGIVASIDGEAVRQRLTGIVPARTAGGVLAGLAILITVRQIALIITALTSQALVDTQELALWIDDFTVACPALLVGGFLLWRRKTLGYVVGVGLLLAYGALSVGLILFLVFQARFTDSTIDVVDIVVLLIMAAICFATFAFFVRGAAEPRIVKE